MQISEYVTIGHPDKIADYISEYILDRLLEQDPLTRYALEVQIKDNFVTLGGEITTNAVANYDQWVKDAVNSIGYNEEYVKKWGIDNAISGNTLIVSKHISQQSRDIALGVNNNGWGDQGIMFGIAVNSPETNYMPLDHYLAKLIGDALFESGVGGLDIKTQVVLSYGEVVKIIVAIPLLDDTKEVESVVKSIVGGKYELIINGTGCYVTHSSIGDCGTTGRKLAVDFYGGNCNVGGGSPWTKDGTKADLTLNLYARYLAVNYIKESGCDYVKCGIGCCIGRPEIDVTFWDKNNNEIMSYTTNKTPDDLISLFNLRTPIFAKMCRYGLFSIIDSPWIDK